MHYSVHVNLVGNASFSKELAFNAKSADGRVIDVAFWRNKLQGIREEIDVLLNLLGNHDGSGKVSLCPVVKQAWERKEKSSTQELVKVDGLGPILSSPRDLVLAQKEVSDLDPSDGLKSLGQLNVLFHMGAQDVGGGLDLKGLGSGLLRDPLIMSESGVVQLGGTVDGADHLLSTRGQSKSIAGARGTSPVAFPVPELKRAPVLSLLRWLFPPRECFFRRILMLMAQIRSSAPP